MKSAKKTIIVMVAIVTVVLGGYYIITNYIIHDKEEVTLATSEVEMLLEKDLIENYPATPKEVIKLFSRMSKSFYDREYNDKQYEGLVEQFRILLDRELRENNPENEYVENLKNSVKEYQSAKRGIASYYFINDGKVKYATIENQECATIQVAYTLREGTVVLNTAQEFLLRQDENNNWKVLGWKSIEQENKES